MAILTVTRLAALGIIFATPLLAEEPRFEGRKSVESFWQGKGVQPHVAAGIADNVSRESSFDPAIVGDGGGSLGLYQHHNERMTTLLAAVENEQAFRDVMGADPIAAAHWDEIKRASSRQEAARLWAKYFERCAHCGGSGIAHDTSAVAPTGGPASTPRPHVATIDPLAKPEPTGRELVFSVTKKEPR